MGVVVVVVVVEKGWVGSGSSNTVGTVFHPQKTGSEEECKRNLKR